MPSAEQNLWTYSKSACGYLVREARDAGDLAQIAKLRASLFTTESETTAARLKKRDLESRHLVVFDEATGEMVGCYRLTCSLFSQNFECSEDFDISHLLAQDGVKLELGYACVHPSHRHGPVIRLMLAGIRDFCSHYGVATIFGNASLNTTDRAQALRVYDWLNKKAVETPPRRRGLTPLLHFYHHLGAIVLALPVLDREFGCFDFLMALDLTSVPDWIWKNILNL